MRRSTKTKAPSAPLPDSKPDAGSDDGSFQAMDHMANWVRFADTKATILTAGLGVILTILMAKSDIVARAITLGNGGAYVVGTFALLASLAFAYTLLWLVRAIGPQSTVSYHTLNRFAWPTLHKVTTDQLTDHALNVDVRADAWRQVIDLSILANRKFEACGKAAKGFATLVFFGVVCVATAIGFTT